MAPPRPRLATVAALLLALGTSFAGAGDIDLSDIKAAPAVERKGGSAVGKMLPKHEKWVEMETKGTKATPKDLESVCADKVALCNKDPECKKGLDLSFKNKPFGKVNTCRRAILTTILATILTAILTATLRNLHCFNLCLCVCSRRACSRM